MLTSPKAALLKSYKTSFANMEKINCMKAALYFRRHFPGYISGVSPFGLIFILTLV